MITKEIIVNFQNAVSPKISTMLLQKAYEFKSHIWVEKEDNRADARSLLDVLSLGIADGNKIAIIAEGADEQEAVEALAEIVKGCLV